VSPFLGKCSAGSRFVGAFAAVLVLLLASVAGAVSVTFDTPSGSTVGGQPVSASATFVTGVDSLTITLTNLQDNPTSIIQNLSDLSFVLSGGQTSGSLTSSSGLERNVAADGTFTDGATVATGWELETFGSGLRLHVLGTAIGPAHTLIGGPDGSNVYSNANGSIAGNDPHNPFLAGTVTFDLAVLGLTGDSTITSAIFSFGTAEGNDVPGTPRVPEPSTGPIFLISGVLAAIVTAGLRRRGTAGQRS
jgi:hypothetical protein